MAKLLVKDLQGKSIKDLVKMRNDLKKELFNLKTQNSLKAIKQTHLIKDTRRNIARLNTVLATKLKQDGNNMK